MVNGPPSEFERDQLLELLNLLRRDPDARLEFQQQFGPSGDALDHLLWRIDPKATGPSGATNPMLRARELEVIVHSPPTGADGEAAIGAAERELSELLRESELTNAQLDAAISFARERTSTPALADRADEYVPGDATDEPDAAARDRRSRWRTAVGLASAAAIGAVAASVAWSASTALNTTTAERLPSPVASSSVPTAESQVIVWIPVEGDLLPDVDARRSMDIAVSPDELVAATSLGIRGAWSARGFLSDAGQVCMSLSDSQSGTTRCAPYADFVESGLTIDRGSWSVSWQQNGTVVWDGI